MSALDRLNILDLTDKIDRIPRRPGHQTLAAREGEEWITYHYSAVFYADRSRDAELRRILSEATYQIGKNWAKRGKPPIYGDGLMYDFVVLSDGLIVRTRRRRQRLWHCNNTIGNNGSWSVHAMLGPNQNLTDPQRVSTFALFDALRADSTIPRQNVVSHCEWPLTKGLPVRSERYRLLAGQSACPGPLLHAQVVAYRSLPDRPARYLARVPLTVYEVPRVDPTRIALGGTAILPAGQPVTIDVTYPESGMAHLVGGLGFVVLADLVPEQQP
jgi:hypothetical protein